MKKICNDLYKIKESYNLKELKLLFDGVEKEKVQVFGSYLYMKTFKDIDVVTFDIETAVLVQENSEKYKIPVDILFTTEEEFENFPDLISVNNIAFVFHPATETYSFGENFTSGKVLTFNNNSLTKFRNSHVLLKQVNKLRERGFMTKNDFKNQRERSLIEKLLEDLGAKILNAPDLYSEEEGCYVDNESGYYNAYGMIEIFNEESDVSKVCSAFDIGRESIKFLKVIKDEGFEMDDSFCQAFNITDIDYQMTDGEVVMTFKKDKEELTLYIRGDLDYPNHSTLEYLVYYNKSLGESNE